MGLKSLLSRLSLFGIVFVGWVLVGTPSEAATRIGPVLTYQQFHRSDPENAEILRWGGGVRASTDLIAPVVALEFEGLYTSENDIFATGNTFDEAVYRGRGGLLLRVLNLGPLHFGLRGGAQYTIVKDEYNRKAVNVTENTSSHYLSEYAGLEIELTPLSGFGIQTGVTFSYDKVLLKWMPEVYLGIVLR